MSAGVEREIKLRFETPDAARAAVLAAGGVPLRGRRLQDDRLFDAADQLRSRRSALRVRMESGRTLLTFKGPVQPSAMKMREELETAVVDGEVIIRILESLGYRVWFRYQKYREEFSFGDVVVAVDETPVGTFVELEGTERGIQTTAAALGRSASDYVIESYRTLFVRHCEAQGIPVTDMLCAVQ